MTAVITALILANSIGLLLNIVDIVLNIYIQNNFLANAPLSAQFKAMLVGSNYFITTAFLFPIFFMASSMRGRPMKLITACLFSVVLIFYVISWLLMILMKEFLDVEALKFFVFNFTDILAHVMQSSPQALAILFISISILPAIVVIGCIKSLPILIQITDNISQKKISVIVNIFVVVALALVIAIFMSLHPSDRLNIFVNKVSPLMSVASDFILSDKDKTVVINQGSLLVQWEKKISFDEYKKEPGDVKDAPVFIIVVESLGIDILNDDMIMPNLYQLKEKSIYFRNFYSVSNESSYAWPAILSSQYPLRSADHHYYSKDIKYPRVFIYDVLKQHQYKTAIFSAQNEGWGDMKHYLESANLDMFFDANSSAEQSYIPKEDSGFLKWVSKFKAAGKLDDAMVLDQALPWMDRHLNGRFFITFNFQRSHFPYTWPEDFKPLFAPYETNFRVLFGKYPADKATVMKNRYFNALAYVDIQIGRLITFLKEKDIYEKSIIIVLGDHGEAFYERPGISCHASSLFNETVRTPLIIKKSNQNAKEINLDYVQSIDIPPTICQLLGMKIHPGFQGVSMFNREALTRRPIFMTIQNPFAVEDAVIMDGWKLIKSYSPYLVHPQSLYNLSNDEKEEHNLIKENKGKAEELASQLTVWRQVQLEYYANSPKQKEFYAPKVINGTKD